MTPNFNTSLTTTHLPLNNESFFAENTSLNIFRSPIISKTPVWQKLICKMLQPQILHLLPFGVFVGRIDYLFLVNAVLNVNKPLIDPFGCLRREELDRAEILLKKAQKIYENNTEDNLHQTYGIRL